MKQVDYIIVGFGLAGMAFADLLERKGHTFTIIDKQTDAASRVAAGLINPVILKRYTMPWQGEMQFDLANAFFNDLASRLQVEAVKQLQVYKLFSSIEDQNNWFEASDKPVLSRFLNSQLKSDVAPQVEAKLHCGEVRETLKIDIPKLLDAYKAYLETIGAYAQENFEYEALQLLGEHQVQYKEILAKKVIFAEGYGIHKNPFFNKLPLVGNKGEYIDIHAPGLKLTQAVKASFFIIPLGADLYKVGATFNWKDKDSKPTEEAQKELIEKLNKVLKCEFEVVAQHAAVRPTTGDRRPLLGVHPQYKQLVLLNGLGTRGTMMAPYLAQQLYAHLELGEALDEELSIMRFPKKF